MCVVMLICAIEMEAEKNYKNVFVGENIKKCCCCLKGEKFALTRF